MKMWVFFFFFFFFLGGGGGGGKGYVDPPLKLLGGLAPLSSYAYDDVVHNDVLCLLGKILRMKTAKN